MRVLVTGANGFLGGAVVEALRLRGHECHTPGMGRPRVDLTDRAGVASLVAAAHAETLVHAAWYAGDDRISSPENAAWVDHTALLVDEFLQGGGRRVVTLGTCFEYELGSSPLVEDETPIRPHTPYGEAKASVGSDTLARCDATTGATAAHARIGYVYGPGERPPRLVPALVESLASGQRFATTSGTQRRDYSYVDDIGRAVAVLAEHSFHGPVNVGSGEAIAVAALVTALARELDALDLVDFGALPLRPGDPDIVELSIQRLTGLGWHPGVSLSEGARRTVDALRDHERTINEHD